MTGISDLELQLSAARAAAMNEEAVGRIQIAVIRCPPLTSDNGSHGKVPLSLAVADGLALGTKRHLVQTIIGLLGSWVAGTEVKSIIKGATTRHALGAAIWSILIHGDIRGQGDVGNDPNERRPPHEDA
jgi:hypothetical protein